MALAGSDLNTESYAPTELFAGSENPVTDQGTLLSGQNLAKWTVLGMVAASGKYTVFNPAGNDGSQYACAILLEAVNASGGDKACSVYRAGTFNHAALVWPASIDTLLERQQAFSRSPIAVKALYHSV